VCVCACMSSLLTEQIFVTIDTGLSYENLLRICQFGYSLAKYLTFYMDLMTFTMLRTSGVFTLFRYNHVRPEILGTTMTRELEHVQF
jgi:hypothetical protein